MTMVRMARLSLVRLLALVLVMLPGLCSCRRQAVILQDNVFPGMKLLPSEEHAAFIVPVRKSYDNPTALHLLQQHHRRELIGADAYMKLHDDLLNKGYYTTELHIGTPPQKYALIVDTGSTVTYVPCSTCKHCGVHQDPNFNPSRSSTYQATPCDTACAQKYRGQCGGNDQCIYVRSYAENSTSSGALGSDLIGFGAESNLQPQRLVFGCENNEEGDLYRQKADGIMGLGRSQLSVVDQLVQQGAISDSFSLCYGGMNEEGGAMILGSITPPPGMVFTSSDPGRSIYYNVPLHHLVVAGKRLLVDPAVFDGQHGTIIDSGTTYCYLPGPAFDVFVRAVRQHVSSSLREIPGPDPEYPDICFGDAGSDPSKLGDFFPTVDFVFNDDVVLPLAPENYLFRHVRSHGGYCLGVFKNDREKTTLLGGIVVRNMLVTYDRQQKRIGFWRTKCTDLANQLAAVSAPPAGEGVSTRAPPLALPSAVPPTQQLGPPPQVVTAPPPLQPGPGPDGLGLVGNPDLSFAIASLEMDILFGISSATFAPLQSAFVEDMAREFQLHASQVDVLSVTDKDGHISVHWAILPAPSSNNVTVAVAEDIVSRLVNHSVQLQDAFGSYQLTSWKLQPLTNRSRSLVPGSFRTIWIIILASLLIVSLAVLGIYGAYQWSKSRHTANYMTIQEMDEKVELQPL